MRSPREALIYMSEDVIKKNYGLDGVAFLTYRRIMAEHPDYKDPDSIYEFFDDEKINTELKNRNLYYDCTSYDYENQFIFYELNDINDVLETVDFFIRNNAIVDPFIQDFIPFLLIVCFNCCQ
jgi:hypothetical protein